MDRSEFQVMRMMASSPPLVWPRLRLNPHRIAAHIHRHSHQFFVARPYHLHFGDSHSISVSSPPSQTPTPAPAPSTMPVASPYPSPTTAPSASPASSTATSLASTPLASPPSPPTKGPTASGDAPVGSPADNAAPNAAFCFNKAAVARSALFGSFVVVLML